MGLVELNSDTHKGKKRFPRDERGCALHETVLARKNKLTTCQKHISLSVRSFISLNSFQHVC